MADNIPGCPFLSIPYKYGQVALIDDGKCQKARARRPKLLDLRSYRWLFNIYGLGLANSCQIDSQAMTRIRCFGRGDHRAWWIFRSTQRSLCFIALGSA